jgi:SPP1 family phage portal protein
MSYGRRRLYTDATEITAANVIDEVKKVFADHLLNRSEIETLWEYYRGKTRILQKQKEVRESINHKVNENRAYEIVSFHKGYTFGEAIQYVRRENATGEQADDPIAADINALNGFMSDADKAACDNEIAEWLYVAGTSYRMVLPNPVWEQDGDEPPFLLYCLDPRQTFVVYSSAVGNRPMMAIHYVNSEHNRRKVSVYTDQSYFEFDYDLDTLTEKPLYLGMIPIIEYQANTPMLGSFEVVKSLIDALDELQSNRMDDIVQYVNSFLAILGGQLDEETYKKLNEWKTLCLPEGTDAKYLSPTMNQNDVQTLKDDLYQTILTITGLPNRNGGSSTSDTGVAVVYRDGFATANTLACSVELFFKRAEKRFLKLVLRILRDTVGTQLKLADIETHFTRRNYENIANKAQVLTTMLNSPRIHPELSFQACGLFCDPESAYLQSKAWWEEQEKKWEAEEMSESEGKPDV